MRYAPPKARVEDVVPDLLPGELALRLTRLWAALIDTGIGIVLLVIIWLVAPSDIDVWGLRHLPDWSEMLLRAALGYVGFLALHGYLLATRGQTIGKALCKVRIVRLDGSKPTFVRIAGLRTGATALLSAVPKVGYMLALVDVLFIFTKSRRCLHDFIANTKVVQA